MVAKKKNVWQHVMECAVFGSVDYQQEVPSIALCNAETLKMCIAQYVSQEKNCSMNEANEIYSVCAENALKQEKPENTFVNLASIGSCIGVIALIIIVLTLFATHFNLVFLFFTVMACSFIGTCNEYIRTSKRKEKATQIWKNALGTGSIDDMRMALLQMEQVFQPKGK